MHNLLLSFRQPNHGMADVLWRNIGSFLRFRQTRRSNEDRALEMFTGGAREGRLSIWESSSKCQSSPQKSCGVEISFHAAGKRRESWLESRLAAARDQVDMENFSFLHPAASAERSGAHGLNGSGNHGIVGESFPP
jgi:hypothetical protein